MTMEEKLGRLVAGAVALTAVLATPITAAAQQVTGVLGSASATTTIDGRQLPPPQPPDAWAE